MTNITLGAESKLYLKTILLYMTTLTIILSCLTS